MEGSEIVFRNFVKRQYVVQHGRTKVNVDQQDLKAGEVHQGYYWLGNEWSNLLLACQLFLARCQRKWFPYQRKSGFEPH